ncbi:recombination regulator RecX [Rhodoferax koreense]|uniref:Regulatory protein RecX n=1 Tax=Rhodoferax koreensis TaxID=1842727 RepID=A0A1P8K2Q0_9BURK|nr:recombination regulator RecX [Rhodoferax koreense]APW40295.1 recombination regulator RecX [Rhodoferax koreense]
MAFDPRQPSLKGRALRYLAGREHSRAELERKLVKFEEEPGELQRVLDELQAKDFISEARVVESVLHQRAPRMGAARVRQELQHKGVAPEVISEAVDSLRDTEFARASEVWRRRFGALPQDPKEHARQARFLMARGFSGAVVGKLLRAPQDD